MSDTTGTPLGASDLILFVTGDAPRSRRARANLRRILQDLGSDSAPREIDLVEQPEQGLRYGIFASPALLRMDQSRPVILYGDLSEDSRLRHFLGNAGDPVEAE